MKNFTIQFLFCLGIFSLAACGKNDPTLALYRQGPGGGPQALKDQVDMSQCRGNPPAGATIAEETWSLTQTKGTFRLISNLAVKDNSTGTTTLTVLCDNGQYQVSAAVTIGSSY